MYSPFEPAAGCQASDEALMQAITARDPEALNALYQRYRALLAKIVAEILPVAADAEEALQDVLMEVWKRADHFSVDRGKPLGWLICVARRRAIDHYRKVRRRAEGGEKLRLKAEGGQHDIPGVETQVPTSELGGQTATATRDLRAFLNRVISKLPAEQGRVIHLTYFADMSQREIAASTGIPLGTIKTRLELALRKLEAKLQEARVELQYAR